MKRIASLLALLALLNCSPKFYTLNSEGEVVQVEQNRIRVNFSDVVHPEKKGAAWFYIPGIGVRDTSEYRVIVKIEEREEGNE